VTTATGLEDLVGEPIVDEVLVSFAVDCRYFDAEDMQSVVRGIEAAAVETALDPNAPTRVVAATLTERQTRRVNG
jgi:hypothetical protein